MRHRASSQLWFAAVTALIVVGAGCGGDSDDPAADDLAADAESAGQQSDSGAVAEPEGDSGSADPSAAEMTTERLCDPVEPEVLAVLGDAVTTEHNDFYADREDRILQCTWVASDVNRTIKVGYNGNPSDTMVALSTGEQDLAELDVPNVYAMSRTDLLAPNGWTISIQNLGADQTEIRDATIAIANAALGATES